MSEAQLALDFEIFLQGFMDKHPEFKGRPLYIAGESYAGHYIPAFAKHITDLEREDINL